MTFVSPPASNSRSLRRPRRLNSVVASVACSLSILNSPNPAEANFSLPDWPLASAGEFDADGRIEEAAPVEESPGVTAPSMPTESLNEKARDTARLEQSSAEPGDEASLARIELRGGSKASATPEDGAPEESPAESALASNSHAAPETPAAELKDGGERESFMTERTRILLESGILERQSEIGEGILLLERQLRHADMVRKFMAIMGPAAPVEVSPGRFEDFSRIPEGRRLAAELRERELEASIRELELQASVNRAKLQLKESEFDLRKAVRVPAGSRNSTATQTESTAATQTSEISLRAIYGSDEYFTAIVAADGRRFEVMPGDILPGGARVASIEDGGIIIERDGESRAHKLFWR